MSKRKRLLVGLVCYWLWLSPPGRCGAVQFQFAGIAGNSGGSGVALVHTAFGRQGGGVIVDKQGRIFTGGGDRIVVLNAQGHLLWETRPPQDGWVLGFASFAVAGDYLYFLAGPPVAWEKRYYQSTYTMVEPNLCRTLMTPSAVAEVVAPTASFANYTKMDIDLTSDIRTGQVYVGYATNWDPVEFTVFRVGTDGTLTKLFAMPLNTAGVVCDEEGNFYVGGNDQVWKLDNKGKPLPGLWPVKYPNITVYATYFSGAAMLTPGELWMMGTYGFLGRYTRDFQPLPGIAAMHLMPLDQTTQIAAAPDGNYYIKSLDALYLASLENDKIKLLRRFGAIPLTHDLALTAQGYIGLGDEYLTLWFNFDDADPAAPPANAQDPGATANGFPDEDGWDTIGLRGLPMDYNPMPTHMDLLHIAPEPLIGNNANSATASGEFRSRIHAIAKLGRSYFAIAGPNHRLFQSSERSPFNLQLVEIEPDDGFNSLCTLGGQNLLLTSKGQVEAYGFDDEGTPTLSWTLQGPGPRDLFGPDLSISADGNQILVADSTRHRILLFETSKPGDIPTFLAQYGETDVAGTENEHLNHPTLVCLRAGRAIVYDEANQRVVKLHLH